MSEAIVRKRGDTYAIPLTIIDSAGAVQDITGKAFVLTVNSVERPVDASTELFQLVGTVTDAENGEVEFPMTDEQANHVGEFYYDVEMSDADGANRRTVLKSSFTMEQDITKGPSSGEFDFSGETVGESIALDRSGIFIPLMNSEDDSLTYEDRSGTTVIRAVSGSGPEIYLGIGGDAAPFTYLQPPVKIKALVYFSGGGNSNTELGIDFQEVIPCFTPHRGKTFMREVDAYIQDISIVDGVINNNVWDNPGGPNTAGWYWIGLELTEVGTLRAALWSDGNSEPDPWPWSLVPLIPYTPRVQIHIRFFHAAKSSAATLELAKIVWEGYR